MASELNGCCLRTVDRQGDREQSTQKTLLRNTPYFGRLRSVIENQDWGKTDTPQIEKFGIGAFANVWLLDDTSGQNRRYRKYPA